jgi:hypothetical protein
VPNTPSWIHRDSRVTDALCEAKADLSHAQQSRYCQLHSGAALVMEGEVHPALTGLDARLRRRLPRWANATVAPGDARERQLAQGSAPSGGSGGSAGGCGVAGLAASCN